MWQALFAFTNIWAMLAWVLLVFFPRKPLTYSACLYLGVALLCLLYTAMFALVLGGLADPHQSASSGTPSFSSIEGVRAFFGSDGGVVIGWTHYLAFDLFTGLWISRDADAKGFGRIAQAPILMLTFLVGPVGLLSWLVLRERAARRQARAKAAA
ncbi:ABA4-like family protein [Novosphingobium sp.]|uniref:ABA4-like family protein n=1 Tax=Novosphingobium sp. TaxID=1874826 RepID=UPI00286BC551|nr:ABA4-like family protein [Novosphingobium sp.]